MVTFRYLVVSAKGLMYIPGIKNYREDCKNVWTKNEYIHQFEKTRKYMQFLPTWERALGSTSRRGNVLWVPTQDRGSGDGARRSGESCGALSAKMREKQPQLSGEGWWQRNTTATILELANQCSSRIRYWAWTLLLFNYCWCKAGFH